MAAISSIFSKVPAPPLPQPKITASNPGAEALDVFENSNATLVRLAASVLKDSHLAQALTDQQQKTDDAINTLSQAKKGLASDAKSAALQKLELARRRLQLLRSLGGDPKVVAQQAKQIAQQIAAAAREYGDAVNSDGVDLSVPGDGSAEGSTPNAGSSAPETSATKAALVEHRRQPPLPPRPRPLQKNLPTTLLIRRPLGKGAFRSIRTRRQRHRLKHMKGPTTGKRWKNSRMPPTTLSDLSSKLRAS
jgi:hypothetical protein